MTTDHPDPHTLAGAYALDALPDAERAAFEAHLAGCRACADELRSFREAAARLGAAAGDTPPPHLRARVLAVAHNTRQLAPITSGLTGAALRSGGRRQAVLRRLRAASPRHVRSARLLVATVVLALIATTGGLVVSQHIGERERLHAAQRANRLIASVLGAPDAEMLTAPTINGAAAHVVMSHEQHALVVSVSNLPPLVHGKCYQVWLIRDDRDADIGILQPPTRGLSGPLVTADLRPDDHLGLSVEDMPGAVQPTTSMLLDLDLR